MQSLSQLKSLVRDIVEQITVVAGRIEIRLSRAKIAAALEAEGTIERFDLDPVVLSIEAKLRAPEKGSASSSRMAPGRT